MIRLSCLRSAGITLLLLSHASCTGPSAPPTVSAQDAAAGGTVLTIYSSASPALSFPAVPYGDTYNEPLGFGVVRERRQMSLREGINRVEVTDIAREIDPTTVAFRSLTDPDAATVLEQNMEFDIASARTMLGRFLGREVILTLAGQGGEPIELPCTLLAVPDSYGPEGAAYLVRTGGPNGAVVVQSVEQVKSVRLPDSRGDILSKPTLNWSVRAEEAGTHDVEIAYQTDGLTWRADYGLLLAPDEKSGDMTAWVSVLNQSGITYADTKLKLIAGNVRRLTGKAIERPSGLFGGGGNDEVQEQAFADYHLYTLPRPTTLPDNSTKQIELFGAKRGVPVQKNYVWTGPEPTDTHDSYPNVSQEFGTEEPGGIHMLIRFRNSADAGLGIPLPAGRVRVYKADPVDGAREFVGEDVINHTPVDEPVSLFIGTAFDIVGSRRQIAFERGDHQMTETFEVSIRNRKKEPAQVIVRETMYRWKTWKVTESSDKWTSPNAEKVEFLVDVPPGGEKTVRYTVTYTW